MRKVITFLGTRPQETQYEHNGHIYSGHVFAQALRQFVEYDEMLVLVTREARENTWPVLEALGDPRLHAVDIPRGENTAEMWQTFDKLNERVGEGETVIFDITHGLRSLPFLVFLFAAYLKSAKRVHIEAIYYGAYELGDRNTHRPAPVIDLSGFVQMLDWLTATDQFVQTGDARRLADLLDSSGRGAHKAAEKLSDVSLAAFLCQPFTLMREARTLRSVLQQAHTELADKARPFGVLQEQILGAFESFGADPANPAEALRAQLRLIEWYYGNNQLIQAMTLAREWLISAVTWKLGKPIDLTGNQRVLMDRAVSGVARVGREPWDEKMGKKRLFMVDDLNEQGRQVYDWPEREDITLLWDALSDVRNALDHAEQKKGSMGLKTIVKNAETKVMPRLRLLAAQWGLTDPAV